MLRSRIIPCLLVHNKGLVKTVRFKDPKYVGDPINAVKIFNEKEVDELVVLDIDASKYNTEPNFNLISNLAVECRMPFCYGGGIKTVEHAEKIINLGVEKIAISSAAIDDIDICNKIGNAIGFQSLSVVIDVKKNFFSGYTIYTNNGKNKSSIEFNKILKELDNLNVGEIIINSIDNDGLMKGYDMKLADYVRNICNRPLTILGGAGNLNDVKSLITKYKIIGAAAGSLFVFKGKYKAVLINYPNRKEKLSLY